MRYNFEWDLEKNKRNQKKHRVTFEQAATVFRDPRMLSLYDDEHSEAKEERWITLGLSAVSGLLIVHHTFREIDAETVDIRIFSSRKATKQEIKQYSE
ncbi:MAG: BrnT family toxin [Phycisphaerae bacterium]|nr:BrnT family toxin [Phycisphaerae bacterium]